MKEDGITRFELDPDDPPEMTRTDRARLDALSDEDIHSAALSDPDAQPLTEGQLRRMRQAVDVKAVRENLALSQREFSDMFHLPLNAVKNWETGRSLPDQVARILLKVILHNPEAVKEALEAT